MKDVRTDAQGRVYLWLPAGETAAPYDIVQLSLHKCTPHRRAYSRPASAVSGALAWESIEVTYKCKGVGCNPNFEQKATVPPRCQ